jgi:hypothetical protein
MTTEKTKKILEKIEYWGCIALVTFIIIKILVFIIKMWTQK